MMLILKSRTTWSIVLMFLIGGIQAVSSIIPAGIETALMAALGLLATYFHVNPSQNYTA